MAQKQTVEIFRCDARFKTILADSARRMNLDKSSFIRWAVRTASRQIKSHGTGVRES